MLHVASDDNLLKDVNVNVPKLSMGRLSDVHTPLRRSSKDDPLTPHENKSGRTSKDCPEIRSPDVQASPQIIRQKLGTPRLVMAGHPTPRQHTGLNSPLTPAYASPAGRAHVVHSPPSNASTSRDRSASLSSPPQNVHPAKSPRQNSISQPKEEDELLVIPTICHDQAEKVIKYYYDVKTDTWTQSEGSVYIHPIPFQEGTMRTAFHLFDLAKPDGEQHFVCKMSKDPEEDSSTYFDDVEMQAFAKLFAEEFNKMGPPKRVDFVEAALVKCLERKSAPVLAVEPFLKGKYVKHSNNFGFVSEEDRNTPQAFSHFTYCKSRGDYLICDIQGVQDKYTDPQIHSRDGKGFGKGNMGIEGMVKFFQTHRCNAVCKFLNLPSHQPKQVDVGTVVHGGLPLAGKYGQSAQLAPIERKQFNTNQRHRDGTPVCSNKPPSPRMNMAALPPGLKIDPETEGRLRRLFNEYDKEMKGYLELDSFQKVCAIMGMPLMTSEAKDIFSTICSTPGKIDYRSFVVWWATKK